MTQHPHTTPVVDGNGYDSVHAEISREMVRLYKELFGRGPTKARTEFAGADIVICTLENTFTPAERSLADMGEHQRLRDTRMYFQAATSERFREIIERVTGRKVRAFISGLDADVDVCAEIFYLESKA
ncbi:MAG TPA: Na-translocating system protein MpsC family protein [Solirubrobacterales bacterium]|nr:Na-translocating system protein MpsC family protein [Solirubrobacterales bacterium]